jgi:IclR family transcriptional regulator, KDG regulon repressor
MARTPAPSPKDAAPGGADARYDVPAVRQVLRLIELLCDAEQPLGVSQIGQALGLNKSMIFRLLQTLHREGWVIRHDDGPPTYRMGLRPFHHLSKPVSRMNLMVAAAGPLRSLWQETGESIYLGVLDGDRVLYLEHLDGTRPAHISGKVGGRYALHCSAPGKCLLAGAGDELVTQLAKAGLERQTRRTITDPAALRRDLQQVQRQGFAVDLEEYASGCICFAAPVRNYTGRVVGVIGTSVLTLHYTPDQLRRDIGPKIRETARAISRALGHEDGGVKKQP